MASRRRVGVCYCIVTPAAGAKAGPPGDVFGERTEPEEGVTDLRRLPGDQTPETTGLPNPTCGFDPSRGFALLAHPGSGGRRTTPRMGP